MVFAQGSALPPIFLTLGSGPGIDARHRIRNRLSVNENGCCSGRRRSRSFSSRSVAEPFGDAFIERSRRSKFVSEQLEHDGTQGSDVPAHRLGR
jgi:hypothetical protein